MPDNHYENSKLAEIYDLDSPWSIDREFYLSLAGDGSKSILDLGCGTGLLCNAYAERNHDVTGVDPSAAMLEVARKKPFGDRIEWVQSFAQDFSADKQFDLIIMTGHAFQVLLEEADVQSTLAVMRTHLKRSGSIVFESRNPAIDWSREWNYDMVLELPSGISVRESRRLLSFKNARMSFELVYEFPDETLRSDSELLFLTKEQIEKHMREAGLRIHDLQGDWDGSPFNKQKSQEMIFTARLPKPVDCCS